VEKGGGGGRRDAACNGRSINDASEPARNGNLRPAILCFTFR
jgi:hypothetical protein